MVECDLLSPQERRTSPGRRWVDRAARASPAWSAAGRYSPPLQAERQEQRQESQGKGKKRMVQPLLGLPSGDSSCWTRARRQTSLSG
eukprot:scaffold1244_cov162-Ochromonas_danica.AAC.7